MLPELHLAHRMGYTKTLEMNRVIKIEYLEENSINGTGTKAQLNKERIKQITGERMKKII